MTPLSFVSARQSVCGRFASFVKNFADAGVFFPAANVCNFMQGGNPFANKIAIANLAYSSLLIGASILLKKMPDKSATRKWVEMTIAAIHGDAPTRNPLRMVFRVIGRELSNPLRVTAYCAIGIGGVLVASAAGGSAAALFPGLAGLFFGLGNFLQSSASITERRASGKMSPWSKALTHPAVWYGLGYTMTGIGIGGGLSLLSHPFGDMTATILTFIGVAETVGALGLMISGKVTNQAAPFVGVAAGTACFALTGVVTGNILGAMTGGFACAGELSLAVLMQKLHNATQQGLQGAPPSRIESVLTAPIHAAMRRGWISSLPKAG